MYCCTALIPLVSSRSLRSRCPEVSASPAATSSPSLTWSSAATGMTYSLLTFPVLSSAVTTTLRESSSSTISTFPGISVITAPVFGVRASKISSTRGKPWVISKPTIPPKWKVLIVNCVPGSPID